MARSKLVGRRPTSKGLVSGLYSQWNTSNYGAKPRKKREEEFKPYVERPKPDPVEFFDEVTFKKLI